MANSTRASYTDSCKPWNTDLTDAEPTEELFIDYFSERKTEVCNLKLKTPRLDLWIQAHRDTYPNGAWSTEKTQQILTEKSGSKKLVVRFGQNTGIIVVQGALKFDWRNLFKDLLHSVNTLSFSPISPPAPAHSVNTLLLGEKFIPGPTALSEHSVIQPYLTTCPCTSSEHSAHQLYFIPCSWAS